jgi:SAM-dependent methyltransferase
MPQAATLSEDLYQQYDRRFAAATHYRDRVWKALTALYFQRFVPADSALLDLGSGYGQFINNIRARSKFAMDLNPSAKSLVGDDVTFFEQDCATRWPIESGTLDVVFTSNFLEHLPSKAAVRATLQEVARCLRPGGSIICLGPNVRFVPGAYWDFWDHHVALSDRSLAEVLDLAGLRVSHSIERFLPYTMSEGRQPPVAFLELYLRCPMIWPLLGKQFMVIARLDEGSSSGASLT